VIVDFHCHSTASDGTVSPAGLARRALDAGFAALALTDHDNCDGVAELRAAAPRFVAGVEISIDPGEGFDLFHLLGIGIDPGAPRLRKLLADILEGRNGRNGRILENFSRIGIDIPPDEIARYAHGEVLARPHFAKWLADRGFAKSVKDGMEKYLLPDSPAQTRCYEERWRPSQEEAFAAIHEAGGLCIMAHPKFWRREWKHAGPDCEAAEKELSRLMEAGLDGVEALYQANTPAENVAFIRLASRLGCLKSAGSDFHGGNKPSIPLGMEVSAPFIAPLLERLGIRAQPGGYTMSMQSP